MTEITAERRKQLCEASARWRAANPERALELGRRYESRRDVEMRRAGQRRRAQLRRQAIDLLKAAPCTDCGVRYAPYVMQFDHRDPELKEFNVGHLTARSWAVVMAEIEKCDLVCANCHAERTWGPGRRASEAAG